MKRTRLPAPLDPNPVMMVPCPDHLAMTMMTVTPIAAPAMVVAIVVSVTDIYVHSNVGSRIATVAMSHVHLAGLVSSWSRCCSLGRWCRLSGCWRATICPGGWRFCAGGTGDACRACGGIRFRRNELRNRASR